MYVRSDEEELTPMQMDAYIKRATSCFQGSHGFFPGISLIQLCNESYSRNFCGN